LRDLDAAGAVTSWVDPNAGEWLADLSTLDELADSKAHATRASELSIGGASRVVNLVGSPGGVARVE